MADMASGGRKGADEGLEVAGCEGLDWEMIGREGWGRRDGRKRSRKRGRRRRERESERERERERGGGDQGEFVML